MNPDLERLIQLQKFETLAEESRRTIAEHPSRSQALDRRLEAAREEVAAARQRLIDCQNRRRAEEKDVAVVQARLAKFKDQLLEVKTNREYQAMQHEIEVASSEVRAREDRILEVMLESDDLAAAVKRAEGELSVLEREIRNEREALDRELRNLEADIEGAAREREKLIAQISAPALALFEYIARGRKGLAVAEARAGHCTICHVRLRPQVFNEVRRNDAIIQCESCHRILYFVPEKQTEVQPTTET